MTKLIRRRSPLSELQGELNQLFSSDFWGQGFDSANAMVADWVPAIDIKEQADAYSITADVPGVDPNEIEVHFDNGVLTIKGEKESTKQETSDEYVRVERSKGSFIRRFNLPDVVDSDAIKAKCNHGVLEITVPKSKPGGAKKISVES